MDKRLAIYLIGGAALLGVAGALAIGDMERMGPPFITGDHPVTEDQIRQKLQSEGYTNIQIVRREGAFAASGSKDGATSSMIVDAQTGRLIREGDDDD